MVKNPPADAGDAGSIPELGRSPGGGNGNPVQCSWDFTSGSDYKESAFNEGDMGSIPDLERSFGEGHGNPLQSSFPAWKIPRTEKPVGLRSMGSQKSQTQLCN